MAKKALGKGLGALIRRPTGESGGRSDPGFTPAADARPGGSDAGELVVEIALGDVVASPLQPRKAFRDQELDELAESLGEHGLIQPLVVRKCGGAYELIAGERRWRAAQRAQLATVPALVRKAGDREVLEMALIENLQRSDLNPMEEAQAYTRLAKEFDLTQEQIAKKVGKNRATVANMLRLLDLDGEVQDALAQGRLSTGHAKAILKEKDTARQRLFADQVVRMNLSVRATEDLVDGRLPGAGKPGGGTGAAGGSKARGAGKASSAEATEVSALADRLREHLGTKVTLHHGAKRGRIEIEYYGNDDLDRILGIIGVGDESVL